MLSAAVVALAGCQTDSRPAPVDSGAADGRAGAEAGGLTQRRFCDLPGSVQYGASGTTTVPGGPSSPSLAFLKLPAGYCAHYFGNVGNARQLRFAPGGELFVASPTQHTTGGFGGQAAIVVLPDDDGDGFAEAPRVFLGGLPMTQGLLFANGYVYYQNAREILRRPYQSGDRVASGVAERMADVTFFESELHWPKTLDQADDGTIYVTNGDDEGQRCDAAHPFHGGVLALDGSPAGRPVAKGMRNPIGIRCPRGKNLCFVVELSRDYSSQLGGREKVVPLREGDDWGYPCCATRGVPFTDIGGTSDDCAAVPAEDVSFLIGDTPFGIDFELGKWPAPYTGSAFIPLHGAVETWEGARVVAVAVDPATGKPLPGRSDGDGASSGAMSDFATGWDDQTWKHGRPASVVFAADGRLFLGNDNTGDIIWIAPFDLERRVGQRD